MTVVQPPQTIGSIKTALKELLLGPSYTALLQKVERDFSDGIPLPALEAVFTANKETIPVYPACELQGDTSDPDSQSDAQDYEHHVELWFWVNGSDEEVITAQCERYILAARRLLHLHGPQHGLLMPSIGNVPVRLGREDCSPVGRGKQAPQPFLKIGVLELFVGTVEV